MSLVGKESGERIWHSRSWNLARKTDVGLVRSRNEDFMGHDSLDPSLLQRRGHLYMVADGMGGHSAGNVASKLAVEVSMRTHYQAASDDVGQDLVVAIQTANHTIHDEAAKNPAWNHMGTTVVAVVILGDKAYVANVGDSRLYLVRQGSIQQITQDHSLVAMQVALGNLSPEEAEASDSKAVLLRSVGPQPDVKVDLTPMDPEPGDIIVLCTDGLHGLVTADEIQSRVVEMEPEIGMQEPADLANSQGASTISPYRSFASKPCHRAETATQAL